jgi:general secretion pathway protein G
VKSSRNIRRGFTLIEIMLVMAIIVIIASFAVVAIQRARGRAQINQAKIQVSAFDSAIELFCTDTGSYPTTSNQSGLQALRNCPSDLANPAKWGPTPYLKTDIPPDPWGREYQYCQPGRHNPDTFDVWSLGPDGQDNTADDIGNWQS